MLVYLQMIDSPEDESKFEVLYKEHRDYMYRVAFNILHNPQDAEDAVHHAFVKVAENIKKIYEPKCLKTGGISLLLSETAQSISTERGERIRLRNTMMQSLAYSLNMMVRMR